MFIAKVYVSGERVCVSACVCARVCAIGVRALLNYLHEYIFTYGYALSVYLSERYSLMMANTFFR